LPILTEKVVDERELIKQNNHSVVTIVNVRDSNDLDISAVWDEKRNCELSKFYSQEEFV